MLFVPNPFAIGYRHLDHIDGNPANNNASNLQFVKNHSENVRNPITFAKKINNNPVLQIDLSTNAVTREWENAYTAGKTFSFQSSNILSCCKGKLKSAYGFKWRFK